MLLEAAEAYIKAVNTGRVPNVENAWTYVCQQETDKAIKISINQVDEIIAQEKKENPGFLTTNGWKDKIKKRVLKEFSKKALGSEKDLSVAIDKLQDLIDQKLQKIESETRYNLEKELSIDFEEGFFIIKARVMKGEIRDIGEVHEKLMELEAQILKGDDNQSKKNVLANLKSDNADEATGIQIVSRAVESPLRTIVENAGLEGSVVVAKVSEGKGNFGYNAKTDEYVDMLKAGIIDPKKVTRVALENAASVSGMILTTECALVEIKEENAGAGMPMGGGMPGMM
jgi:hypothetical protein